MKDPGESILNWIVKNNLKTERGDPIEFDEHFFMLDIMVDWFPKQVCMKSAQVGWSTAAIIKSLYGMRYLGLNCIYTLPTFDDVRDFVPAKVDGLINGNPSLVKELGRSDAIQKKQFGNNFIWYRGTFGKKAAIMHTSDLNIYDELDASNLGVIDLYTSRLQKSKYKGEWKFSNPIRPGGIDREYERSDQRRWMVKCSRCNRTQDLDYWRNVCKDRERYVCSHCNKILSEDDRHDGEWVAAMPSRSDRIHGYHINQLMVPWISAPELIELEETKGSDYFYNMVLGLPFVDATERVSRQVILKNVVCVENPKLRNAMGVDVKYKEKHYVLGNHDGIFKVGIAKGWPEIEKLIKEYNPITVIDMNPDFYPRTKMIPRWPGLVFCCQYVKNRGKRHFIEWGKDDKRGFVYTDRSQIIQHTVNQFLEEKLKINSGSRLPDVYVDDELPVFIKHFENIYKKTEVNSMGIEESTWEKSGEDDFVHACGYFLIALSKVRKFGDDEITWSGKYGEGLSPEILDGKILAERGLILAESVDPDVWKY